MAQSKFENAGDKVSKTFCILPWVHQHTWPNGDVYPCCVSKSSMPLGNMKKAPLEEIWNSEESKELRRQLMNGEKPDTCSRCFMHEEIGTMPFRVSSNNNWKHRIDRAIETTDADGYSHDFRLNYWDFRFSNVCNLKCRMCGPELSSSWYQDQIQMFGQATTERALIHVNDVSVKNINEYVDQFIDQVEEIYFAGGEPLMMDEHYHILEKLLEIGNTNCRIRYNTNFTKLKFKKWDVVPMWRTFADINPHNVRIVASLDAVDDVIEYVRTGTKWKVVDENIRRVLDQGLMIRTSSTINLFNVYYIPEFVDRMLAYGLPFENIEMNNILTFPDYYHMNILPDDIKVKVIEKHEQHLRQLSETQSEECVEYFRGVYDVFKVYLYQEPGRDLEHLRRDFKSLTLKKDRFRKTKFVDTFPLLKDWYNTLEPWSQEDAREDGQHLACSTEEVVEEVPVVKTNTENLI